MTILAYDPEQLASLHIQMKAALEERRRLTSTDPAAAEAMRIARLALSSVEQLWAPLVRNLLITDPLAGGAPATLADVTLLRLDTAGVSALAAAIAATPPDDLRYDPRLIADLADELELIGARPDLVRVLLDELDRIPSYAAAQIVAQLDLHGTALAEAADAIICRWWLELQSREHGADDAGEYNPADVLFPLIAADRAACVRYVELAGAHPRTLFEASTEPELTHAIAYSAFDPALLDSATAARLLLPLLDWFADDWYPTPCAWALQDPDLAACLAHLLAPWTVQMSPLNHDWQLTAEHQRHLLEALLRDDRALAQLIADRDRLSDAVLDAAATNDPHLLAELAAYAGMLAELVIHRRYDDEQMAADAWAMIVGVTATIVALPLGPGGNLTVAGAATILGTFNPYDPERAAGEEFYAQSYTRTVTIALLAHHLYAQWSDAGSLPPGTPPPPSPDPDAEHPLGEYYDALLAWQARLPGGTAGPLADDLDAAILPWVLGYDAGAEVGRM